MKESGAKPEGKKFGTESLYTKEGCVSFSAERGGIITSLQLRPHGSQAKLQEVLYMDSATFHNPDKNVRGGIPILFPQAGPVRVEDGSRTYGDYSGLPQHGLARTSNKWRGAVNPHKREFTEQVQIGPQHAYPHTALLRMTGRIERDGTFYLKQSATNLSQSKDIPIAMGLHPYFQAPRARKNEIVFSGMPTVDLAKGADGADIVEVVGKTIEECAAIWGNGGTLSVNNPLKPVKIIIPEKGTLVLEASREYLHFWIWSLPSEDFICLEPVMRETNGLISDPHIVKPGNSFEATFSIALEKTTTSV